VVVAVRLGLVTYQLGAAWDLATLLESCAATGFEGVELRTTHAHGVEVGLGPAERDRVRRTFADTPVALVGLGTALEYHALEPAVVRRNVEATREHVRLAHDLGAPGVKVRPNGHHEAAGVPRARTIEQIGRALRECGAFAADLGVELRLEMHAALAGAGDVRRIMEAADHPGVGVCRNSNPVDVRDGSVGAAFAKVADWIALVHLHDLYDPAYPYRELFRLLRRRGYDGYCCAEVDASADPLRVMRYDRALFDALQTEGPP
jgi:sugar phosphate isomerase/epimerase